VKEDYDLIIIGAGSAGITAARFARQLGLSVALVEKSRIGGDCTWTGCVPSKSLLKAASVAYQMRSADQYGLVPSSPPVNLGSVMARVRSAIQEVYQAESPEVLQAEGIDVVMGEARFLDRRTLRVESPSVRDLTARRYLVATGAKPLVPPIQGIEDVDYLTYESVWDLEELPKRLTVAGGGPIGCELAQAFCRLGSSVTLLEAAGRLLLQDEPEASEFMNRRLTDDGIDLRLGAGLEAVAQGPSGISLSLVGGGQLETDALLVAVGRRAYLSGLGLDEAGVAHERSGIKVDRNLRTSQEHIYAAGDCAGGFQFTHYAGYQGFMAVRNAFLPLNGRAVLEHVPWATFTDPEVAHVGLTESQARERYGPKAVVSDLPMNRVDRAVIDGDAAGFIKLVHLPNGKLLGATVVAPRAGEMIHEWSLALDRGLKLPHLAESVHVYPTYSIATQQLAAQLTVDRMLAGTVGKVIRRLARGLW
jgi:pyruvate/2-oxoglutarate dehydrogenase complex dihydrolipoamide dehydrogenase (E3) component